MLKHRLILGTLMAAAAGGVLYVDSFFAPYFPILLILALTVGILATRELVALIPPENRPREWLCHTGVIACIALPFMPVWFFSIHTLPLRECDGFLICSLFVAASLLVEILLYREPGSSITRTAHCVFVVGYLGLFACVLIQIRWLDERFSGWMLALAIFVPKCCDIGAYFTGRLIGRHPCTPRLSPKKTWEGMIGGLVVAMATTLAVEESVPIFSSRIAAMAFGLTVGLAGILGDLAESLIKRDAQAKDASRTIPGFGGILDVIDSILFAAPVSYVWFFIL